MCAAMVGADPDALDRLAGSFDQQARLLDATAQRVRAQVQASPWRGGAANRFRADWDHTHMPRLRHTASALRSSAKILRQQATDQRNASSAGGGSIDGGSIGAGLGAGTRKPWWHGLTPEQIAGIGMGGRAAELGYNVAEFLASNKMNANYGTAWRGVLDLADRIHMRDAMSFKKWDWVQDAGRHMSRYEDVLSSGGGVLKWAGRITSGFTMLDEGGQALESARNGEGWNAGAHGLRGLGAGASNVKGIGSLLSAGATSYAITIEAAQEVDVSSFGSTMNYARNNMGVVADELRKATVSVFGDILGFKKWNAK